MTRTQSLACRGSASDGRDRHMNSRGEEIRAPRGTEGWQMGRNWTLPRRVGKTRHPQSTSQVPRSGQKCETDQGVNITQVQGGGPEPELVPITAGTRSLTEFPFISTATATHYHFHFWL